MSDLVPKRLYDEEIEAMNTLKDQIKKLEEQLTNLKNSEALLLTKIILEDFSRSFLKKFLPDKVAYSSADIIEAYKKFLLPDQKSYKKVKKNILHALADNGIDQNTFLTRIGEIYHICSSYIHTFKMKNKFNHAFDEELISMAVLLSEEDERYLNILNSCLKC